MIITVILISKSVLTLFLVTLAHLHNTISYTEYSNEWYIVIKHIVVYNRQHAYSYLEIQF